MHPIQIHILLKPLILATNSNKSAIIVVMIPIDPITIEIKVITSPNAATLDPGIPSFPRSPRLNDLGGSFCCLPIGLIFFS